MITGKTEMSKSKTIVSLIMNALIVIFTTAIVVSYFTGKPGVLIKTGVESFKFFTTDSNILSAIAALIVLIFDIRILVGKDKEIPGWAVTAKYVGTTSVMLTFATVMLFLGPMFGYYFVLKDTAFYMHFVGPLLALLSLWFFEPDYIIPKRFIHLAAIPMAIYGTVYLIEVLIIGEFDGWDDFYGFNTGGRWYLSIAAILLGTYLLAIIIRLLHNHTVKKRLEKSKNE